ncbi:MAG: hypothetical protein CM15mP103_01660 [Gammaproteobacteria bacterium]|nr:MAG: hypothetical protein CM15mP103_01660 [Gammaproteobacteria bacterium]
MTDSDLGYQIFRWVKYLTYALLSLNIFLFLAEEIGSARFAIASGEDVVMGVQLFPPRWIPCLVILLLLFELETAVIPDERLKGLLRLAFTVCACCDCSNRDGVSRLLWGVAYIVAQ